MGCFTQFTKTDKIISLMRPDECFPISFQCVIKLVRFKNHMSAIANTTHMTTDSRVKNRICF